MTTTPQKTCDKMYEHNARVALETSLTVTEGAEHHSGLVRVVARRPTHRRKVEERLEGKEGEIKPQTAQQARMASIKP